RNLNSIGGNIVQVFVVRIPPDTRQIGFPVRRSRRRRRKIGLSIRRARDVGQGNIHPLEEQNSDECQIRHADWLSNVNLKRSTNNEQSRANAKGAWEMVHRRGPLEFLFGKAKGPLLFKRADLLRKPKDSLVSSQFERSLHSSVIPSAGNRAIVRTD